MRKPTRRKGSRSSLLFIAVMAIGLPGCTWLTESDGRLVFHPDHPPTKRGAGSVFAAGSAVFHHDSHDLTYEVTYAANAIGYSITGPVTGIKLAREDGPNGSRVLTEYQYPRRMQNPVGLGGISTSDTIHLSDNEARVLRAGQLGLLLTTSAHPEGESFSKLVLHRSGDSPVLLLSTPFLLLLLPFVGPMTSG